MTLTMFGVLPAHVSVCLSYIFLYARRNEVLYCAFNGLDLYFTSLWLDIVVAWCRDKHLDTQKHQLLSVLWFLVGVPGPARNCLFSVWFVWRRLELSDIWWVCFWQSWFCNMKEFSETTSMAVEFSCCKDWLTCTVSGLSWIDGHMFFQERDTSGRLRGRCFLILLPKGVNDKF